MPFVCKRKSSCRSLYKNKIVVLDTSALIHIIGAISSFTVSRKNRFNIFVSVFEDFFVKMSLCSYGGEIHTTKQVFEQEIDPTNVSSAVHETLAFENICSNHNDFSQIREIIERHIRIPSSAVSSSRINEIKRLLRDPRRALYSPPSTNDLSLLVLGMEKASDPETVIITDDTGLHRALDIIQRRRYANISSRTVDTRKLKCTYSISYFEEPYKCCEVCSRDFYALYGVLLDYGENINARFNPSLLTSHLNSLIIRVASEVIK